MTLFILWKAYKWVMGIRGGREGGYLQTVGEQRSRKKDGEEGGERGKGRCIFSWEHVISQGRGGEAGAGGTEGGETGVLLTTAKLSPTTPGHFSGTFLQFRVSERAGGWRGQPLSDVDSVKKKVRRQGGGYISTNRPRCSKFAASFRIKKGGSKLA